MRLDQLESPVCTHDGVLHRVPRGEMRVSRFIRARMACDMRLVMADRGIDCVLDADMIGLGWTREQIAAHGEAAARIVRGEAEEEGADGPPLPPPPTFTRAETAAYAGLLAAAAGLVIAGLWSIASQALAAQSLGHRVILSMVL
jgi:hypothetical protein